MAKKGLVLIFLFPLTLLAQTSLDDFIDFSIDNQTITDALWSLGEVIDIPIIYSAGFFDSEKTISISFKKKPIDEILKEILGHTNTKYTYREGQILILRTAPPQHIISGYLMDSESGERLIGAHITNVNEGSGTVTNDFGFYSFRLKEGNHTLLISYLGYAQKSIDLNLLGNQNLNIKISPDNTLQEIVVVDQAHQANSNTQGNTSTFGQNITKIPTLAGEIDLLRSLQILPGTATGTDGFGGMFIRGGNADQNIIILDGAPVYNPYHTLGLFSIFDPHVIKKADFYKGGIPARYGGRLSSVVDVHTKDGNLESFHGRLTTGLIASKISLEGPIIKNKAAFVLSAKRSHIEPALNWWSKRNMNANDAEKTQYAFGDFLGKLNYQLTKKDRLYFSFYRGFDQYENEVSETDETLGFIDNQTTTQKIEWGNTISTLRWSHELSSNLFSNLTLNFSKYQFNSDEGIGYSTSNSDGTEQFSINENLVYLSGIDNSSAKLNLDYLPTHNHFIKFGFMVQKNNYDPGLFNYDAEFGPTLDELLRENQRNKISTNELNAFIEDNIELKDGVILNVGLNSSFFAVRDHLYKNIDPRINFSWQATHRLKHHLSINRLTQYQHLLTRSGSGLPNDIWVPSTNLVAPEKSWILDMGTSIKIGQSILFEPGIYYKKMDNLLDFKETFQFSGAGNSINSENWEENVTFGEGNAYGLEISTQYTKKRFHSTLSYTYAKTQRTFEKINNGNPYPFRYDLRHNAKWMTHYVINKKWRLSSLWNYSSGGFINLITHRWQYITNAGIPDLFFQNGGAKNSFKLPAQHRLDISAEYASQHKWGHFKANFGIYNVYNRRNIQNIRVDTNRRTGQTSLKSVSLIPILPYFNLTFSI